MVLNGCDAAEDAADWIDAFGSTHPVLCDYDDVASDLYRDGFGNPQHVVIDRDMNIIYRSTGPADPGISESRVLDLL